MEKRIIDDVVKSYYQDTYSEDNRLQKDKVHKLEFITTTNYIDKYLSKDSRILEVGAGTGAYSIYYAKQGYQVDAMELVPGNVALMNNKITVDMRIKTSVGNAVDLAMYEDDTFDMTLVLGPLYHLFSDSDVDKCIKEAIRVTKPGGVINLAFILFDMSLLSWGFIDKNIYDNYGDGKQVTRDFKPVNKEELIFNLRYLQEVKDLLSRYPVDVIHYVATDGVGRLLKDTVNSMTEEEYKMFIKYHLSTCEREDLMGYSGHILAIVRKR